MRRRNFGGNGQSHSGPGRGYKTGYEARGKAASRGNAPKARCLNAILQRRAAEAGDKTALKKALADPQPSILDIGLDQVRRERGATVPTARDHRSAVNR
jgi:hypothetical protein